MANYHTSTERQNQVYDDAIALFLDRTGLQAVPDFVVRGIAYSSTHETPDKTLALATRYAMEYYQQAQEGQQFANNVVNNSMIGSGLYSAMRLFDKNLPRLENVATDVERNYGVRPEATGLAKAQGLFTDTLGMMLPSTLGLGGAAAATEAAAQGASRGLVRQVSRGALRGAKGWGLFGAGYTAGSEALNTLADIAQRRQVSIPHEAGRTIRNIAYQTPMNVALGAGVGALMPALGYGLGKIFFRGKKVPETKALPLPATETEPVTPAEPSYLSQTEVRGLLPAPPKSPERPMLPSITGRGDIPQGSTIFVSPEGEASFVSRKAPTLKTNREIIRQQRAARQAELLQEQQTIPPEQQAVEQAVSKVPASQARKSALATRRIQKKSKVEPIAVGKETGIRIPSEKEEWKAKYAIVPIDDVLQSHTHNSKEKTLEGALASIKENPKAVPGGNERNYANYEEQQKLLQIVENPDNGIFASTGKTAVVGPIAITKKGFAVAGNGRALALKLIKDYQPKLYEAYKRYIKENAHLFGLDPKDIDLSKDFALVRILDKPLETHPDFIVASGKLNEETTNARNLDAVAKTIAPQIDAPTLERVANILDPEKTFNANLSEEGVVNELMAFLNKRKLIPPNEMQLYIEGNKLTPAGRELVKNILYQRVFGETPIRALHGKVEQSLDLAMPAVVKIATQPKSWDISTEVNQAARMADDAIKNFKDKSGKVDFGAYMRQENLKLGEGQTIPKPEVGTKAYALTKALTTETPSDFKEKLQEYYRLAHQANEGGMMFDVAETHNPDEAFLKVFGDYLDKDYKAGEKIPSGVVEDLQNIVAEKPKETPPEVGTLPVEQPKEQPEETIPQAEEAQPKEVATEEKPAEEKPQEQGQPEQKKQTAEAATIKPKPTENLIGTDRGLPFKTKASAKRALARMQKAGRNGEIVEADGGWKIREIKTPIKPTETPTETQKPTEPTQTTGQEKIEAPAQKEAPKSPPEQEDIQGIVRKYTSTVMHIWQNAKEKKLPSYELRHFTENTRKKSIYSAVARYLEDNNISYDKSELKSVVNKVVPEIRDEIADVWEKNLLSPDEIEKFPHLRHYEEYIQRPGEWFGAEKKASSATNKVAIPKEKVVTGDYSLPQEYSGNINSIVQHVKDYLATLDAAVKALRRQGKEGLADGIYWNLVDGVQGYNYLRQHVKGLPKFSFDSEIGNAVEDAADDIAGGRIVPSLFEKYPLRGVEPATEDEILNALDAIKGGAKSAASRAAKKIKLGEGAAPLFEEGEGGEKYHAGLVAGIRDTVEHLSEIAGIGKHERRKLARTIQKVTIASVRFIKKHAPELGEKTEKALETADGVKRIFSSVTRYLHGEISPEHLPQEVKSLFPKLKELGKVNKKLMKYAGSILKDNRAPVMTDEQIAKAAKTSVEEVQRARGVLRETSKALNLLYKLYKISGAPTAGFRENYLPVNVKYDIIRQLEEESGEAYNYLKRYFDQFADMKIDPKTKRVVNAKPIIDPKTGEEVPLSEKDIKSIIGLRNEADKLFGGDMVAAYLTRGDAFSSNHLQLDIAEGKLRLPRKIILPHWAYDWDRWLDASNKYIDTAARTIGFYQELGKPHEKLLASENLWKLQNIANRPLDKIKELKTVNLAKPVQEMVRKSNLPAAAQTDVTKTLSSILRGGDASNITPTIVHDLLHAMSLSGWRTWLKNIILGVQSAATFTDTDIFLRGIAKYLLSKSFRRRIKEIATRSGAIEGGRQLAQSLRQTGKLSKASTVGMRVGEDIVRSLSNLFGSTQFERLVRRASKAMDRAGIKSFSDLARYLETGKTRTLNPIKRLRLRAARKALGDYMVFADAGLSKEFFDRAVQQYRRTGKLSEAFLDQAGKAYSDYVQGKVAIEGLPEWVQGTELGRISTYLYRTGILLMRPKAMALRRLWKTYDPTPLLKILGYGTAAGAVLDILRGRKVLDDDQLNWFQKLVRLQAEAEMLGVISDMVDLVEGKGLSKIYLVNAMQRTASLGLLALNAMMRGQLEDTYPILFKRAVGLSGGGSSVIQAARTIRTPTVNDAIKYRRYALEWLENNVQKPTLIEQIAKRASVEQNIGEYSVYSQQMRDLVFKFMDAAMRKDTKARRQAIKDIASLRRKIIAYARKKKQRPQNALKRVYQSIIHYRPMPIAPRHRSKFYRDARKNYDKDVFRKWIRMDAYYQAAARMVYPKRGSSSLGLSGL